MSDSKVPITSETPVRDLPEYAKNEFQKLEINEIFMVKDLFLGYEWKRIKIGNRTRLGSAFYRFAESLGDQVITIGDKSPQNQQTYKKEVEKGYPLVTTSDTSKEEYI